MKKNLERNIFVLRGFSRFFIWLILGPQWTHSKRFCPYYSNFQKKIFVIYCLYVKKYIFVPGGGASFFFGDHWDPNEAIPIGLALITVFHRKPPLINLYFEKKNGFVAGVGMGGLFWWSLGPQWTHSNRFRSDGNYFADCHFWTFVASSIYIYTVPRYYVCHT